MPSALAVGIRVEQSGEFLPRASRAGRRHPEGLADSLHRLPQAAEDLQVFIPRRNRPLLLQGEFRITLQARNGVPAVSRFFVSCFTQLIDGLLGNSPDELSVPPCEVRRPGKGETSVGKQSS